jgi:ferredoxin-thioredoxin reductase catalytic subunit
VVEMNEKELEEIYRKYAESQGFKLNPDKKFLSKLLKGQLENERKHGYRYCTCKARTGDLKIDKDIICPCKAHKDEIKKMGRCWCGLFLKK